MLGNIRAIFAYLHIHLLTYLFGTCIYDITSTLSCLLCVWVCFWKIWIQNLNKICRL